MQALLPPIVALVSAAAMVLGAPVPDGSWPESTGNVSFEEAYLIKSAEIFDGQTKTLFVLEPNATLMDAIIGSNQLVGVHCDYNDCNVINVWWDDVCEDALSINGGNASSVATVIGGGARYADDKILQHDGFGTVVTSASFIVPVATAQAVLASDSSTSAICCSI